jgi:hypothetical protein
MVAKSRLAAPIAILNLHKGCPRCFLKGIKPLRARLAQTCWGFFPMGLDRRGDCPSLPTIRHKRTIMGGLVALCGLALLVQHVFERSNFHGDYLLAGIVMLAVAVIVWCVPFEDTKG